MAPFGFSDVGRPFCDLVYLARRALGEGTALADEAGTRPVLEVKLVVGSNQLSAPEYGSISGPCTIGRRARWGHVDRASHVKRVAVFGNAGGGKSTLAKRLADLTGLPLYPLDLIQYRAGGGEVPHEEYLKAHADLLRREKWIIDGFGSVASAWERFSKADTLVYIDLPLITHHWWVTPAPRWRG